jgi:hypothetical protein
VRARNWIVVPMWIGVVVGVILTLFIFAGLLGTLDSSNSWGLSQGDKQFVWGLLIIMIVAFPITTMLIVLLIFWLVSKMLEGKNWARITFIVFDIVAAVNIPISLVWDLAMFFVAPAYALFFILVTLAASIIIVVRLSLLCRRETSDWFRKIRLLRDQQLLRAA